MNIIYSLASSGAKLRAYKAIKQALRNSVRDSTTEPDPASLGRLQMAYLLNESQVQRYVLGKLKCQLDVIRCRLVAFVRFKAGNKPQNFTVETLLGWQKLCLLDEADLQGVVNWWKKQQKKKK